MPYKIVIVFELERGKADVEVERCREPHSLVNLLSREAGFISYAVVKINDQRTMSVQTWESKEHLNRAMAKASAERAECVKDQEIIVLSRQMFAGEVALNS